MESARLPMVEIAIKHFRVAIGPGGGEIVPVLLDDVVNGFKLCVIDERLKICSGEALCGIDVFFEVHAGI
jgi:hypothetical protein